MKIDIIVATRGRYAKLIRMLDSVRTKENEISVLVGFDGDFKSFAHLSKTGTRVRTETYFFPGHRGAVVVRNELAAKTTNAVLYATDDMTFDADAIDVAAATAARLFPDEDGVVGFTQRGNSFHPSGVALILSRFVDRYPGRRIHFPGYYHFAAQEVFRLADKLKRFHLEENAQIYHYHPDAHRAERDATHAEARVHKSRDMALKATREKAGLIWGENNDES